jgi:outer membrane protein OmpA-like peptidoglycan-associated protein
MYQKRISLLLALTCIVFFAKAQFVNDYLVAADKYFASGDYYSASQYYEKYLGQAKSKTGQQSFQPYSVSAAANKKVTVTSTSRQKVIYNLAESYRLLHYHVKALPYYEQAVAFNSPGLPLAKYYYASTLRALEKYDEATAAFTDFLQTYPQKDIYAENAERELANLTFIKSQLARTDLKAYTLNKTNGLNADGGSYAPLWLNDNKLWFTSTRINGVEKNHNNRNRIYQADFSNGMAANVNLVSIPQPKDLQQGVAAISPDGNLVLLTRWAVAKEKRTAAIYESRKAADKWSEPVLSSALNVAGSNAQQPFIMPDGKHVVFSSDRPGGSGGYDLWVSDLDANGTVGSPVNLGTNINTKYDEQAASYHAASNTFIFSTNGRVGMGGFDFFYSTGALDNLSEPKNFGYPVNSIKDDIYFSSHGTARNVLEEVVISSDRDAACCLELFALNKIKPLKQLSGTVLACSTNLPLAGVKVLVMDTINNKVIAEKITDASGNYAFTLEEFMPLKATASLTGYFNSSTRFTGPSDLEDIVFVNPSLCLTIIPEKAIKVENVYYDFNKASLQETSYPSLDDLVRLLNENPTMQIELSAHTDSKGTDEYNNKLSEARAQAVVDYLISKGIAKERLIAKGYGESLPVAPNTNADGTDNPEGRQLNRRTEFKVLKN